MKRELAWTAGVGAAALAIVAIYAWPGMLSWDSQYQLDQARSGAFTDWHPPIMAALWGVLDHIVRGPALMLVLQTELFACGLFVLLRRRTTPRRAAIATLVIVALPPVLTAMAVIWKDNLMIGALVAGTAMLTSPRKRVRWGSLAMFAFAAAVRVNGFSAVIPLVGWLWGTRWKQRAIGCAIGAVTSVVGWSSNLALQPEKAHMAELALYPEDVIGAICFAPELRDDQVRELVQGVPLAHERQLQAEACNVQDPYVHPDALVFWPQRWFDHPNSDRDRAALAAAWRRTIRAYPGEYLWNRLLRFRELIGFTDATWQPVWAVQHEARLLRDLYKEAPPRGHVQHWLGSRMVRLGKHSLLFRPYVYMLIAIVLAIVRRRDQLVNALQLSHAVCLALIFFVAPGPDIRYAQWTMFAVLIALALHVLSGRADASDIEREQRAVAHDDAAVDGDVPHVA